MAIIASKALGNTSAFFIWHNFFMLSRANYAKTGPSHIASNGVMCENDRLVKINAI